ncbi:hypothetical protein LZC95_31040 [Pendulispora brunnea]|uniref:Uncharacterized protein n=1 Tax=Pendulispora brunnea TaxID=2905690 RepID=A0ABZ2K0K4_9BACT
MRKLPLVAGSLPPLVLLAGLVVSSTALANGRYPYGNQLVVAPNNPDVIYVRTTFGILLSEDHGRIFRWICEPLIGFTNGLDPGIGVFDDGAMAVAGYYGLAISHDNSCSYPFVGGGLDKQYVMDIAVDDKNPKGGVVVTATANGSQKHVQVFQTSDNGVTWTAPGPALDTFLLPTTLDVAPSDPQRIYVGGFFYGEDGVHGFVQRSDDRGKTWAPRTQLGGVTEADRVSTLHVSGVDPKDPNRVFVRVSNPRSQDRLLVSNDGGTTFQEVASFAGPMYGFAISPDGDKVAIGGVGGGNDTNGKGVYVASRPASGVAYQFEQRSNVPVLCLKWTSETLYGCGNNQQEGIFVVGKSDDEGRTWKPLLNSVNDIDATLKHCPNGSAYNNLCIADWARQVCLFNTPGALDACAAATADAGTSNAVQDDGGGCTLGPGAASKAATGFAALFLGFGLFVRRRLRRH